VDDEPWVVQGLKLHLEVHYRVSIATSGAAGLELVGQDPPAAIVSDLRMPKMDGTDFLGRARERAPAAVRLLLTGQADLESVIAAVNHAQVFRLLVKPCKPAVLLQALEAACREHRRLVEDERMRRAFEGRGP
jgi:DNA-binding NtrC family response regulator